MPGVFNTTLFNQAILGVKTSNSKLLDSYKEVLKHTGPENIQKFTNSSVGEVDILSEQENEILNGEGGVSGFTERNFEDPSFYAYPVSSPALIQDPSEINIIPTVETGDSFVESVNDLRLAQIQFQESINTVSKAFEEEKGNILDLYDTDE